MPASKQAQSIKTSRHKASKQTKRQTSKQIRKNKQRNKQNSSLRLGVYVLISFKLCMCMFCSILGCSFTAVSNPLPEFSLFCPLLSLFIPLPVAPQCHLSKDVLVFTLILYPLSATLCFQYLLLFFIRAMCPAHFHFVLVTYWTMSVSLVLYLMMVLRILSFSLTLSIFLSMARWLVSCFFTNAFVRDHVCHPYAIAGRTHWLKTFLFKLMERCMSRKISLYFPTTLHPAFILSETSCFVLFSITIVCRRYL